MCRNAIKGAGTPAISTLAALLLALVFVVSSRAVVNARAGGKPGVIPPPELVGRWEGQGRIVNNWTSVQSLPVNLAILPDGTVAGQIGLASIAGGSFEEYSKKKPPYVLTVNLAGALLEDGVMRRSFRLSLRPEGERLTGFGASDGWKMFPGASRESMRRSMRLQVISVSLTKGATLAP
jgi:hypothetical protein